jgi:hypothetical protein
MDVPVKTRSLGTSASAVVQVTDFGSMPDASHGIGMVRERRRRACFRRYLYRREG